MDQYDKHQAVVMVACDDLGHIKCPQEFRFGHDSGAIKKKIPNTQARYEQTFHKYINPKPPTLPPWLKG